MTMLSTAARAEIPVDLKILFKKPLIVGASVSGDYFTASPGKRLGLRYTDSKNIRVIAARGKPAKDVLKMVSDTTLRSQSVVVGLDLFFWDSFLSSPQESFKELDRLVQVTAKAGIPLVLGEIPALMPQRQLSLVSLNKRINELCARNENCKILRLNQILEKVISDEHIVQAGKRYALEDLLPDGLHIAEPASEYLADRIAEVF